MSKKVKSLKRLNDKDLAKLIGGAATATTSVRSTLGTATAVGGSTWLYDCWEGTCTMLKDQSGTTAAPIAKPIARPASY